MFDYEQIVRLRQGSYPTFIIREQDILRDLSNSDFRMSNEMSRKTNIQNEYEIIFRGKKMTRALKLFYWGNRK